MKLRNTMKKALAAVLSLAMVLTSITVSSTAVRAEETLADMVASADYNLALNCKVTTDFTFNNTENNLANLTNGNISAPRVYPAAKDDGGYYQIDLGAYYTVASIDQIVSVFHETNKETYPSKNGYYIQYSKDGVNFTEAKHVTEVALPEEAPYAVIEDVSDVTIEDLDAVRYVRLFYPDRYGYGVQVKQLAVLNVNGDKETVEVERCDNAAGVTVTSPDFNTIVYNITAGENAYIYDVFLDGTTLVAENAEAGQDYTISGVATGAHTLVIISKAEGMGASEGLTSETVEVADLKAYCKEMIGSARNVASIKNCPDNVVTDISELYDEAQAEKTGYLLDGTVDNNTFRAAKNASSFIIQLDNCYRADQFEKIMLAYTDNGAYSSSFTVEASADKETWFTLGSGEGYVYSASSSIFAGDLDATGHESEGIQYLRINLVGNNTWGCQLTEVGIILSVDVQDAMIATNKTPVEAPAIEAKSYTGELLTADVVDTADYTVTVNEGGTDAGSYDVVLTLTDAANYYWSDDNKAKETTKTLTFEITPSENSWTTELAIDSWAYGEEAKAPNAAAQFGDVVYTYSTSEDGEYTAAVPENAGTYYVKASVAETANYGGVEAVKEFTIAKADKAAPEGIAAVDTTLDTNADGKITGVTSEMEYRAQTDTEYTDITGEEIADLSVGTYYVRYKEVDNYNASADTEVVISSGRKLNVTLVQGTGYTIEAVDADAQVEYGTAYAVKVTVADGYTKNDAFVVKANGQVIEPDAEGIYRVESITEDTEITVEGVEEETPAPTSENSTTGSSGTENPTGGQNVTPTTKAPEKVTAPAKAKISKVTAKKKSAKKVKLTIKKVTGADGYQVAVYKTKKNAKKNKKAIVKKTTKKVNPTLKSKKLKNTSKLFVKVRAYVLDADGNKVYGAWSKVKKVKIK